MDAYKFPDSSLESLGFQIRSRRWVVRETRPPPPVHDCRSRLPELAAGPGAWLPSVSQYAWLQGARSASAELRKSFGSSSRLLGRSSLCALQGPTHRKRRPCKRLLRGFQRPAHRFKRPGRGRRAALWSASRSAPGFAIRVLDAYKSCFLTQHKLNPITYVRSRRLEGGRGT